MSVDRAADEAKQSNVKDLGDLVFGQPHPRGELDREETRPQRLLKWLAHTQVGGERQRGHQLGQAQSLRAASHHVCQLPTTMKMSACEARHRRDLSSAV